MLSYLLSSHSRIESLLRGHFIVLRNIENTQNDAGKHTVFEIPTGLINFRTFVTTGNISAV